MSRSSSIVVNVDNAIAIKLATYMSELMNKEESSLNLDGTTFLNNCNDYASKNDIGSIVAKLNANVNVVFATENFSGKFYIFKVLKLYF